MITEHDIEVHFPPKNNWSRWRWMSEPTCVDDGEMARLTNEMDVDATKLTRPSD
jgi:hypothetical protein